MNKIDQYDNKHDSVFYLKDGIPPNFGIPKHAFKQYTARGDIDQCRDAIDPVNQEISFEGPEQCETKDPWSSTEEMD